MEHTHLVKGLDFALLQKVHSSCSLLYIIHVLLMTQGRFQELFCVNTGFTALIIFVNCIQFVTSVNVLRKTPKDRFGS